MPKYLPLSIFLLAMLCIPISGCNDVVPVWSEEIPLENYTLYYSEPCEFKVDLSNMAEPNALTLNLMVTYYVGIGRTNLPLFLVIEDEDHNLNEFHTELTLKEDNEWLGIPDENEIDYTIPHIAIPSVMLNPGRYTLKIYANDDKAEKIYGVVAIQARFFPEEGSQPEAG